MTQKEARHSNIEADVAHCKEKMRAHKLEEKLRTHNKARPTLQLLQLGPLPLLKFKTNPKMNSLRRNSKGEPPSTAPRGQPTLVKMIQRLDATREAGTIPRATPTSMEGDVLPSTQMHRVPAKREHFPDTSLLDTTLPDPADYDDNRPLTIDKGTLAANLSTETIQRLGSVPQSRPAEKATDNHL